MRSWAFSGGVTVPVEGNCRDSSFGVLASQTPLWLTLPLHLSLLIIHPMSLFVLSRLTNMLVVQISMFVNRRLDSRFPRIWRLSWHNPWCVFFFFAYYLSPSTLIFMVPRVLGLIVFRLHYSPLSHHFPTLSHAGHVSFLQLINICRLIAWSTSFSFYFFALNFLQLNRLLTWVHLTPP